MQLQFCRRNLTKKYSLASILADPLLDPLLDPHPSGRVLSISDGYRVYLRSSPIISFLDALAFLLRILVTPCILPVSLHQALHMTIRARYKNTEDESAEGLQALQKQTWLRWIFFIVGTLGPAIKLMAIEGVPWTKAWGLAFLFALLVIEAAALVARRSTIPSILSSLPGIPDEIGRSPLETRAEQNFESMETFVLCCGLVAHCVALGCTVFDLWNLRAPAYTYEAMSHLPTFLKDTDTSDRTGQIPNWAVPFVFIVPLLLLSCMLLILICAISRIEVVCEKPLTVVGFTCAVARLALLVVLDIWCIPLFCYLVFYG